MTDHDFQPTFLASLTPMAYQTTLVSNKTGREDEVRILNTAAVVDLVGCGDLIASACIILLTALTTVLK